MRICLCKSGSCGLLRNVFPFDLWHHTRTVKAVDLWGIAYTEDSNEWIINEKKSVMAKTSLYKRQINHVNLLIHQYTAYTKYGRSFPFRACDVWGRWCRARLFYGHWVDEGVMCLFFPNICQEELGAGRTVFTKIRTRDGLEAGQGSVPLGHIASS